ncbi:2,4'-dihydroxyacetophenone dioxygenase family protein [Lysobacter changpingensis]|uniref:2,4'-dihydroxyacetophenone dioxygenase family protein n=1 Tax=Lysobacter changpingensis TaxID=2792784 RepID=UPI001A8FBA7E|nr:2,4'-dihydroxyacetophenone dioxygenase family protein [Lysobacter changpingensis]
MYYEHVRTSLVDDEALPWVPFSPYADNVLLKYFRLDPIRGEMIVLIKVAAGTALPRHRHSGTVIVYTIEGRWKYREHDWIVCPGSIVFETAASSHTPEAVSRGGRVVALNIVVGDVIFFDDSERVLAVENWKSGLQRYLAYCERAGITPRDLTSFE